MNLLHRFLLAVLCAVVLIGCNAELQPGADQEQNSASSGTRGSLTADAELASTGSDPGLWRGTYQGFCAAKTAKA